MLATSDSTRLPVSLLSPPGHCLNVDDFRAMELLPTDNLVCDAGFESHAPHRLGDASRPAAGQTLSVSPGRVLGAWTVSAASTAAVAIEAELTEKSRWVLSLHGASCKAAHLGGVVQAVPTRAGAAYTVTVSVANRRAVQALRAGEPLADATGEALLSFGSLENQPLAVDGADWATYTFVARASSPSTVLTLQSTADNCMWVDNVSVYMTTPPPANLAQNGDFETPQLAALSADAADLETVPAGQTREGWKQITGPGRREGLDRSSASGLQSWRLRDDCDSNTGGGIVQRVPVTKGMSYTVSFFARGYATEAPFTDVGTVSFGTVQVRGAGLFLLRPPLPLIFFSFFFPPLT